MRKDMHTKVHLNSFNDGCQRQCYRHRATTKGLQGFGFQKLNKPRQPHRVNQQETTKQTSTSTYQWRPKQVQKKEVKESRPKNNQMVSTPSKTPPRYQRYTREQKGKWIPQTSLASVKNEELVYQTTKKMSIKERAATLGAQLFGWRDTTKISQ